MTKNFSQECKNALDYSDVFLVPGYSDVSHRQEIDISSELNGVKVPCPIISANMKSVTGHKMCLALMKAGALGALHRFHDTIEETCEDFKKANENNNTGLPVLASVGTSRNSREMAMALHEVGVRYFVVDVAHGHSKQMKDMIYFLKKEHKDSYVIAGNVATFKATQDLLDWGADSIKTCIANGSVCVTKNITGVSVPSFTAVLNCVEAVKEWKKFSGKKATIIADGGFKEIGDISKAIGAGANFVMSGRFFAGCDEVPGPRNIYYGNASWEVQNRYRKNDEHMPVPEGKADVIEPVGPVSKIIEDIAGGTRSAFSYCGARNMKEFQERCKFGYLKK